MHPEEVPVRKKWAVLGAVLALTSSLVFTFYGLLIKQFKLDFVDTLFVRSITQTTLAIIFVKIKVKLYIPSILNTGFTFWNPQWVVSAVKY